MEQDPFPALSVVKGNVIAESVTEGSPTATVQLTDVTTGKTVSASGSGVLDQTYASDIANYVGTTPTSGVPQAVPDFGHVAFTNAESMVNRWVR